MKITIKGIELLSLKSARISLVLLFLLPSISFGEKLRVTIIPSGSSNAYAITAKHIKTAIRNNSNDSIQIKTIEINDLYYKKTEQSMDTDLFVPIGQRALKEVLKYSGNTPVLASLVSKSGFLNITRKENMPNNILNIGAVYIDQPIKRHLLFSRLALPNASRSGFIISRNNKSTIDDLKSIVNNDIRHIEILNPGDNVISTLSRVLEDVDVVVALPDPIVFNLRTSRNILLSTYRKRIPIIGFSWSYVKAGALAAIHSTPDLIGKQTGELISVIKNKLTADGPSFSIPRLHAKYFSISINNKVSRSLGLAPINSSKIEEELLKIETVSRE